MSSTIRPTKNEWYIFNDTVAPRFDPLWFKKDFWQGASTLLKNNTGRGATWKIEYDQQKWILRHYYRGGLYARINSDKYIWAGIQRTRSFQEFNVLMQLQSLDLPAPRPVAASVVKHGLFYQADLIMQFIDHEMTFAELLLNQPQDLLIWSNIGNTIAHFHKHNVYHSDLNAHNILIKGTLIFIIDFDKSYVMKQSGAWKQGNLSRLKRSIEKVSGLLCGSQLKDQWKALIKGYESV